MNLTKEDEDQAKSSSSSDSSRFQWSNWIQNCQRVHWRMHHNRNTLPTDIPISRQSWRLSSTLSRSWESYWVGGETNTNQKVRNFSQELKAKLEVKELESSSNDWGFDEVISSTPNRKRMFKTRVGPETPVVSRHSPRHQLSREDMMKMINDWEGLRHRSSYQSGYAAETSMYVVHRSHSSSNFSSVKPIWLQSKYGQFHEKISCCELCCLDFPSAQSSLNPQ